MKLIYSLLLLIALSSCKQEKNWHDNIIFSEDQVTMVASIDLLGIVSKMDISNSQLPIDQKIMLNGVLSSFDSGILGFKVEGSHRFFLVPEIGKQNGGLFLSGDIVDLDKFKSTIGSTFGGSENKKEGINILNSEEYNLTIGYNGEKFIAGISLDNVFTENKIISYFNSSNKQAGSDSALEKYLERNDDFSYFLSADKLINAVEKMNIPFFNFQDLPIPNINSVIALNFNNGNVALESEIFNLDNDLIPNISGKGLDQKFTSFLTDNDELIGFVLANFDMDEIVNQLDKIKDQDDISNINRNLNRFNITLSEVVKMFDGQLSFSLIDLPYESKNDYSNGWDDDEWEEELNTIKTPEIILNAGLSNQLAFTEFLNKGKQKIIQNEIFSENGINLLIKDNVFHVATKLDLLEKILSNNSLGSCSMVDKNLISEPTYVELITNLSYFPDDLINSIDRDNSELAIKELFKEVERVYFNGNGTKSSLNIDFSDKNKNGLAQLINIISKRLAVLFA